MELTSQYKRGLLKLAALMGLLCFFIMYSHWWPRSESSFVLNEEAQCFVENQESILAQANPKSNYTYYVNSITDYSGYQLGLTVEELDRLFAYRETNKKIYSLEEFQKITQVNSYKLDSIAHLLVFPKYRRKKQFTYSSKGISNDKHFKYDINMVTSVQLYAKLGLPSVIANRVVKYRNYLKGFRSMEQLGDVYDITEEHLEILSSKYRVYQENFTKINLNNTSSVVLSKVPYLNLEQSEQILNFVKNHSEMNSLDDLKKIQGFEKVKIARLPLYLTLEKY